MSNSCSLITNAPIRVNTAPEASRNPASRFTPSDSEGSIYYSTNEDGSRVVYFEPSPAGLLAGIKPSSRMLNMIPWTLIQHLPEINGTRQSTLPSSTQDLRSPSKPLLRHRAHLKRYRRPNSGARIFLQPIPYVTALKAHSYELVPALADWNAVGFGILSFSPLLDPEKYPVPGKLPPRAQRRRLYGACKSAAGLVGGSRCSCSWCCDTRALLRAEDHREFKVDMQEGEKLAFETHWEDFLRVRGVKAWWEMCCEQVDREEEEEDIIMGENGPLASGIDNRWAKLVDDAVSVWERKRRVWAEKTGWEVCSNGEFGYIHPRVSRAASSICSWSDVGEPGEEDDEEVSEEDDEEWDAVSVGTVDI